jgi:hypothetical protein
MGDAMVPRRVDTFGKIDAGDEPILVIRPASPAPPPDSAGKLQPMEERHSPQLPQRGDHSFAVYAAIIGQKPAICPPEEVSGGASRVTRGVWASASAHLAALQHRLKRVPLSVDRHRRHPLFDRAIKCWDDARERLLHRPPNE